MPGTCKQHVPGNLNVEALQDRKKILPCTRYHIEKVKARSIKSLDLRFLKRSSEGDFPGSKLEESLCSHAQRNAGMALKFSG